MNVISGVLKILSSILIVSCGSIVQTEKIDYGSGTSDLDVIGKMDKNDTEKFMSSLVAKLDRNKPKRAQQLVEDSFLHISNLVAKDKIGLTKYVSYLYQTQTAIEKVFQSSKLTDQSTGVCVLYVKDTSLISEDLAENLRNIGGRNKLIVSTSSEVVVSSCHDFFVKNIGESYSANLNSYALSVSVRSNIN